jgi:hypoxanthine phosphoribosyltransferase
MSRLGIPEVPNRAAKVSDLSGRPSDRTGETRSPSANNTEALDRKADVAMITNEGPSWDGTLHVTWTELEMTVDGMVARLREREPFDSIVAIARGGLVPATIFSHRLDLDDVHAVSAKRNTVSRPRSPRLDRPIVGGHTFADQDLGARRVLLVDDICGDGKTLDAVSAILLSSGASAVETAAVFMNERCTRPPTVVGRVTSSWIIFPWEWENPPDRVS